MSNTIEVPFQNKIQFLALEFHASYLKLANFIATPVRLLLESIDGTSDLREFNNS